MISQRQATVLVSRKYLLATWRKSRRWLLWVGRGGWKTLLHETGHHIQRFDITKPVHLALVGLIVGSAVGPLAGWMYVNAQYQLTDGVKAVAEKPSPMLKNKLVHDSAKKANVFNAEGAAKSEGDPQDLLKSRLGGGAEKTNQLYTAVLPDDPSKGIEITDNVNHVSFKFVPQMQLMDGRAEDGRVVYPIKGETGHMIFTPKGNGIKEDIVLLHAPDSDVVEYRYQLELPKSLEARLDEDGSLGFYTGTPELFGNISYGSDKDRDAVEQARANAQKTYQMFKIPAPVVRETGTSTGVTARFSLDNGVLTVRTIGLTKASYPLSIDPTFYITSTTDFVLGSIDDNIDLSVADQVGRASLGGGSINLWTPDLAPSLPNSGQFSAALVAYNGFLYMMGGGCDATACNTLATRTSNNVFYITLDPVTGALGASWSTSANSLVTARQGLAGFGYNGYLYAVGGEDDAGVPIPAGNSVEYAKINSDGSVGTWSNTGDLNTARSHPAGALYQGVLYVMGGASGTYNASLLNTIEWARINGDGTISSWTQSVSAATGNLGSARNRFRGAAYNGHVYITGGLTGTPSVLNSTEYAAIQSDGSLGPWIATTSFPITRRDHGMGINNGYLYVYAGCNLSSMDCSTQGTEFLGDTYYAAINADGSIGQWQQTLQYNYNDAGADYNARVPAGTTFYSNHLYFVGGCYNEAAAPSNDCTTRLVGTFIASLDNVGRFDRGIATAGSPPYTGTSTVARMGAKAVALNGYMYYVSGCSEVGCDNLDGTVEYAQINADGTVNNLGTTTALPAGSGNNAGRIGHTVAAYNNMLYVVGGTERTSSGSAGATPTAVAPQTATWATSTSGNHSYTMSGTINSGDLLLAFFTNDGNATVTTPAGWVSFGTATRGTNVRGSVYARKADGTESGTAVNFVTSAANEAGSLQIYQITGWSGDLSGVAAASVDPGGTTANPNPPSVTTTWGSKNTLWFAYAGGSTWAVTTYPASYTNGTTTTGGSGNSGASTSSARRAVAAGSEDPGTYTMTSAQNGVAFTVAIEPALAHSDVYMTTVLSNTQNSDGTLSGSWSTETNGMTGSCASRAFHTTEVWHNYIYAIGGLNSSGAATGDIYYWPIGSAGALSACQAASNTVQARWGHSGGIWGNWMYVVGGQSDTSGTYLGTSAGANPVQRITLNTSNGNTSAVAGYAVDVSRRFAGGYVDRGILYSLGGDTAGAVENDISRAPLDSATGAVGTFSATNIGNIPDDYPTTAVMGVTTARALTSAVVYDGFSYVLGGCSVDLPDFLPRNCSTYVTTANTTEQYLPNNGGTGQLGTFTTGSSNVVDLPTVSGTAGRADHAAAAYNGKLYVVGGCRLYTAGACTTGLGDIQRADINTDGTVTSAWTAQTSLPSSQVRSGLRAVAYNGHLYVIGGRNSGGTATNTVWHTTIDNTGDLGASWTSADLPSGQERADFGAAITNGYLYVVGGINAAGTRQTSVYYASIDDLTGAVGSWNTTTAFTTARTEFGFAAYNGVLYVAGGYDGSNTLTDVQYANIATNGTIAAWVPTTDIAAGARARQIVGANGYMYFLGDESASNTRVHYTTLSSMGALGHPQKSPTLMNGAHAHGAAVFYNGFIYNTGGCSLSSGTCNTVTAASDKVGQQAISRTGHYSKLFDTQVDTTPTQLVINGAVGGSGKGPGGLVEFKFQTASSLDPVLGIPQLIRPVVDGRYYDVESLNSSGVFVGQAFQYQYLITIDDSRAGTFPDVPKAGYSQTSVQDVTLYYHANPTRRLRHGASFTDYGCNDATAVLDGCVLDTAP